MAADESTTNLSINNIAQKIASGEFSLCDRVARSKVWEVFSRILDNNGVEMEQYVYCKMCGKVFRYNKNTTSNLVKHKCYCLKRLNITNTTEIESPIIQIETEKLDFVENPNNNLKLLIMKWIVKDCRPYDLIQNNSLRDIFQEFIKIGSSVGVGDINTERLLPNPVEVAKNVAEIYAQCFKRVKAEITLIKDNGFGLTVDIWKDNFFKKSYIAATVHFLKSGAIRFRLLGLRSIEGEGRLTDNIYKKVEEILEDFDCKLSSKSIIVAAGDDDILKALPNNQTVPCISHSLNKVLQKAMEEEPEALKLIRTCIKLINFLKDSQLDSMLNGSVPNYSSQRWNILNKMLSYIVNNWSKISEILHNKNEIKIIKSMNLNYLKAVTKILQPFEEALNTLEEDNTPTMHLVLVYLHELKKSCNIYNRDLQDLEFLDSLKENIEYYLEEIATDNTTILHKLALFLYPPTNKLLLFTDLEKKCIEDECLRLMKFFENDLKPLIKLEPQTIPTTPVSKRQKLFSDFVETKTNHDPNELILQELQNYKNTHVVNSSDFDVFGWWQLQKANFPLLYKLSSLVLATPASSAASRRIFFAASNLLCEHISDFDYKETELEQIMFINRNSEQDENNL